MADKEPVWRVHGRPIAYGLDGQPIGMREADELLGQWLTRTVALTDLEGWRISTVFLVFDHNLFDFDNLEHIPVLWETAVFDRDGNVDDVTRYASREAASKGHDRIVSDLRATFEALRDAVTVEYCNVCGTIKGERHNLRKHMEAGTLDTRSWGDEG